MYVILSSNFFYHVVFPKEVVMHEKEKCKFRKIAICVDPPTKLGRHVCILEPLWIFGKLIFKIHFLFVEKIFRFVHYACVHHQFKMS